jgi:hypothetical protein
MDLYIYSPHTLQKEGLSWCSPWEGVTYTLLAIHMGTCCTVELCVKEREKLNSIVMLHFMNWLRSIECWHSIQAYTFLSDIKYAWISYIACSACTFMEAHGLTELCAELSRNLWICV